ncbi:MAG: DUF1967 domain-containing protein, partial [bacterium]
QETWEVFRKYLERSGVNVFLKKKGIKTGDVIVIGSRDFMYKDDED